MFAEPVGWGAIIVTIAMILVGVAIGVILVNKKTKELKENK